MLRSAHRRRAFGLVLLGVLLMLALTGLAALLGAEVWATAVKREKEEELLFVGDQYRRAIESYVRAAPGPVKRLPNSVEELLEDDRFPMPVRHLRRPFRDPIEPNGQWGLVKLGNGIAGVYSTSEAAPLKRSGFPERYAHFESASEYRHWRFVVQVPRGIRAPVPPQSSAQAGR